VLEGQHTFVLHYIRRNIFFKHVVYILFHANSHLFLHVHISLLNTIFCPSIIHFTRCGPVYSVHTFCVYIKSILFLYVNENSCCILKGRKEMNLRWHACESCTKQCRVWYIRYCWRIDVLNMKKEPLSVPKLSLLAEQDHRLIPYKKSLRLFIVCLGLVIRSSTFSFYIYTRTAARYALHSTIRAFCFVKYPSFWQENISSALQQEKTLLKNYTNKTKGSDTALYLPSGNEQH